MGIVDYDSDSASGTESPAQTAPKPPQPTTFAKKPFQKVVDRSNPGKIIVSLPSSVASDTAAEPPAKRLRTTGGGLFSGFNSFLPAPKNSGKPAAAARKAAASAPGRPGVHLKTSSAPGFSRNDLSDAHEAEKALTSAPTSESLLLPPPKKPEPAPSIPDGQTPANEVKLVGKPLMFRPLSVDTKAKKKKNKNQLHPAASMVSRMPQSQPTLKSSTSTSTIVEPPTEKTSLFSLHTEESLDTSSSSNGAYEPLFESASAAPIDALSAQHDLTYAAPTATTSRTATDSLDHVADDLMLSASARRELFGRDGTNFAAQKVVNFNLDKEYQHNEQLRAAGDQQTHNPVRALQTGKHSLKQLVENVQNQKNALEDSFAKGKSNRKEASSRYGW